MRPPWCQNQLVFLLAGTESLQLSEELRQQTRHRREGTRMRRDLEAVREGLRITESHSCRSAVVPDENAERKVDPHARIVLHQSGARLRIAEDDHRLIRESELRLACTGCVINDRENGDASAGQRRPKRIDRKGNRQCGRYLRQLSGYCDSRTIQECDNGQNSSMVCVIAFRETELVEKMMDVFLDRAL